ncbi:biogenesis of lysosome-related organelles complex 1 subunit 4 [Denticeps clupeoides]|uniref:Biogenesis of lysosome-related organelles complex 1 subunit 4 n=1 Tax=Denticeps clupeoides TaxID=299321 RepID=A0AAY4BGT8_9TELE|nr:biogenesis of lysosome-related organelles complex 1 subunit 4-like [Denticeps clupeoides]
MDLRLDRAGALSPLEESSAEVSRDSGIVSQSASSLSMVSDAASGGSVSRSPSFAAAAAAASRSPSVDAAEPRPDPNPEQDVDEEVLRRTAGAYSSYVLPSARDEIVSLEKSLEEMLTRVDEFVGMLDMIRHDTSQVVNENLPQIHRKSEEMRQIYRKIDKLEYFVKMVDGNVHAMEEQVTQAEGEAGTLPGAFKKIFRTMSVPGFLNKPASPKRTHHHSQELPTVFRTDDYFTSNADA